MRKIALLLITLFFSTSLIAAGSDSGSDTSKDSLYDDAVKLVKKAGNFEKKQKSDKAKKLYAQAFSKLEIIISALASASADITPFISMRAVCL